MLCHSVSQRRAHIALNSGWCMGRCSEWSQLSSIETVVPNLFGARNRFRGRQFFHGWGVGGVWFRQCEPRGAADEASLACLPLTSCCAARFPTGRVDCCRSAAQGLGTPALRHEKRLGQHLAHSKHRVSSKKPGGGWFLGG